jgi:hypothetical protein
MKDELETVKARLRKDRAFAELIVAQNGQNLAQWTSLSPTEVADALREARDVLSLVYTDPATVAVPQKTDSDPGMVAVPQRVGASYGKFFRDQERRQQLEREAREKELARQKSERENRERKQAQQIRSEYSALIGEVPKIMKAWGRNRFAFIGVRKYLLRAMEMRPGQSGERFCFEWQLLCPEGYYNLQVKLDFEERSGKYTPTRFVIDNEGGSGRAVTGGGCEPTPQALASALARTPSAYPPTPDGPGVL